MAEHICGSEQEFVRHMNERAEGLGMKNTHFEDCCGLTESPDHYTTARDIAIMSRELITKYSKILEYSSIWMENITHVTRQGDQGIRTYQYQQTDPQLRGLCRPENRKYQHCKILSQRSRQKK